MFSAVVNERLLLDYEFTDYEAAELAKLLENTFRAVNIGLVNEMKIVADAMGLDIFEIIERCGEACSEIQRITE